MKLSPSIYAANIVELKSELSILEECKVDMIHVDIMDGHFVEGMAFGPEQVKMLKKHTQIPLDVHLMVKEPERIIDKTARAGADIITIHQESTVNLTKCIQKIKSYNIKAGVALSPATSPESLKYVINDIDMVLILTVNPGEGGQKFFPNMIDKIKETKTLIGDRYIDIQVDGSIDDKWAVKCIEAGATVVVSGSYLFHGNLSDNIDKMRSKYSKEV